MRLWTAASLLALVAVALPRVMDPATSRLVDAVRALGPLSGWRCVQNATYVYDPRREQPDRGLLAQPPEESLAGTVTGLEVEKVEANLRGGDTVVWTRVALDDDGNDEARVYVLSPGSLQTVSTELAQGPPRICNSHMADWRIVAEHTLG